MTLFKSKQRVVDHGEVFAPPDPANRMLDLVAKAWAAVHTNRLVLDTKFV
jgi:hypothetical protein